MSGIIPKFSIHLPEESKFQFGEAYLLLGSTMATIIRDYLAGLQFRCGRVMISPDYIKILKLDKIAMKSKTESAYLRAVKERLPYAKNLGVEKSFSYLVEQAWLMFGNAK